MSSPDDLRAKISKLSAAIQQHKQTSTYAAPRGRGRGHSTWPPRGRGRGSAGVRPFGNKQLILNKPATTPSSTLSNATAKTTSSAASLQSSAIPSSLQSTPLPNASTSLTTPRNRTVVINGVTFVADASGKKLTRQDLKPNSTPSSLATKIQAPPPVKSSPTHSYTPQKAKVEGVEYVRTKGGNLIRAELVKERLLRKAKSYETKAALKLKIGTSSTTTQRAERKKNKKVSRSKGGHLVYVKEPDGYVRQGRHGKSLVLQGSQKDKSQMYCGYYTRYGKCKDGKKCPFKHDRSHRAICPRYLQNKCPKPAHLCLLSHCPIPEIMPHCSHFQRGKCDRVKCPYPHVRVSPQAPVCKAFALEGYCAKGANCKNKHIHVCPDFAETGKCLNASCKLPHVALKKKHPGQSSQPKVKQWVNPQLVNVGTKREHPSSASGHATKKMRTDVETSSAKDEDNDNDGFVKFDDDDEGWSAFQMKDEEFDVSERLSLHFSDHEEESDSDRSENDSEEGNISSEDVSSDEEDEIAEETELPPQ